MAVVHHSDALFPMLWWLGDILVLVGDQVHAGHLLVSGRLEAGGGRVSPGPGGPQF